MTAYTQGSHGTVVVNANGTYTYTPSMNFVGQDSFDYTAEDLYGRTSTATVTITVRPLSPPENVTGVISEYKLLNRKTFYTVDITWTPSPSPSVFAYRIYKSGCVADTVLATSILAITERTRSQTAAETLEIAAIDALGSESSHVRIVASYE